MTTDVKLRRYKFDLAALQRTAALNYAALKPLLRDPTIGRSLTIKVSQALHFTLEVLDTAPYTTEVRVEQQALSTTLPGLRETQLDVRLYHDAQLAEVVRSQGVSRLEASYDIPNPAMHQPDEKHRVNHFLQEWLQLIQQRGQLSYINIGA